MIEKRVAYPGVPGAFAEEACRAFLPAHDPVPLPTVAAVVRAVLGGEAEVGMVPLENRIVGAVPGVADLLETPGIEVRERRWLPIRLHLIARPGTRAGQLRSVASHPVALAQCSAAIGKLGASTRAESNTALAARHLAESGDMSEAVVASAAAAELYGLEIIRHDVHARPDNATCFGIIARGTAR